MATITFDITTNEGTRTITVDPDDLPLSFNEDLEEAMETNKWRDLNKAFAGFLGLTHAELRQITNRQFKEMLGAISTAVGATTTIPNGTRPPST